MSELPECQNCDVKLNPTGNEWLCKHLEDNGEYYCRTCFKQYERTCGSPKCKKSCCMGCVTTCKLQCGVVRDLCRKCQNIPDEHRLTKLSCSHTACLECLQGKNCPSCERDAQNLAITADVATAKAIIPYFKSAGLKDFLQHWVNLPQEARIEVGRLMVAQSKKNQDPPTV